MAVAGMDPGKTGGMVILSERDGQTFYTWDELDRCGGMQWVHRAEQIKHVFIEKVHAMPGQGVTSMFKFGEGYGRLQGWCQVLEIPYSLVTPQTWQKEMHKGVLSVKDGAKARSAAAAIMLFPGARSELQKKSGKLHDGLVDALLIAEYGRRSLK